MTGRVTWAQLLAAVIGAALLLKFWLWFVIAVAVVVGGLVLLPSLTYNWPLLQRRPHEAGAAWLGIIAVDVLLVGRYTAWVAASAWTVLGALTWVAVIAEWPQRLRRRSAHRGRRLRQDIARQGAEQWLASTSLRPVGRGRPDPGNAPHQLQLYAVPRRYGRRQRVLVVTDGSADPDGQAHRHCLLVPSRYGDPLEAVAATYGLTGTQYARLQRRT